MIKAVIFDMDGVLINTEKYLVKYWCQAAEELGMPMKREHALMIRSFSGKFAEPWLKGIYGETFDYVAVRERRKEIMAEHLAKNGVEIKPGVKETLNYLREKGYKLAVATATDRERAEAYLDEIGITEVIENHRESVTGRQCHEEKNKSCFDNFLFVIAFFCGNKCRGEKCQKHVGISGKAWSVFCTECVDGAEGSL